MFSGVSGSMRGYGNGDWRHMRETTVGLAIEGFAGRNSERGDGHAIEL